MQRSEPAAARVVYPETSTRHFLAFLIRTLSWRFVALVLLTLLTGLVSGVALVLLIPMLQVVGLEVSGGTGEQLVELVFGSLTALGVEPNLLSVLALNATAVTGSALLARLQATAAVRLNQSLVKSMRQRLYRSISRAGWVYLATEPSTRFSHVLLGELERVGAALSALVSLLASAGRALVYIVIALLLSPLMTLVTLLFGLALSLLLMKRTRVGRRTGEAVSEAYHSLYAATGEHLAGLKLTKSHALEDRQAAAFGRVTDRVASAHEDVARNQAEVGFWLQTGSTVALSALIYVALVPLALPLTTVLLLLYLFSRLLPMLAGLQKNYQSLINLLPAYSRVTGTQAESDEAREAQSESSDGFEIGRGIELRDVSFRYGRDQPPLLQGVNLFLPAGRTTAIVGSSGAGKSTIADLVTGLVPPDAGEVTIGDERLTPERSHAWRGQVGYVSQDVFLQHDSIRANLLFARPEASEAEIWSALESAAAGFVAELPEGLDTVVGDRGVRLSGGERQRLVLARALLRRPTLLVLDEATSALDAENEERIREAIDRLSGRLTILVIAHRLASVRSAHCIHFLEGGRVVESGDWGSLLGLEHGRFKALAAAQGVRQFEPSRSAAAS